MITVKVSIKEWPIGKKVTFHGEIFVEQEKRCTTSEITLYFVDAATMKPVQMPEHMAAILQPFFDQE